MSEGERGRPSKYTDELADEACERLAMGESLRSICQEPHMPHHSTVIRWAVQDRNGFSNRYAQARQIQAHRWAEEILEIADNEAKDWRVGEDGELIVEREHLQRSRLRVDTRKWLLSKLLPKQFGKKKSVELTGKGGGPIQHEELSDDQLRERAQQLTNRLAALTASENGDGGS